MQGSMTWLLCLLCQAMVSYIVSHYTIMICSMFHVTRGHLSLNFCLIFVSPFVQVTFKRLLYSLHSLHSHPLFSKLCVQAPGTTSVCISFQLSPQELYLGNIMGCSMSGVYIRTASSKQDVTKGYSLTLTAPLPNPVALI